MSNAIQTVSHFSLNHNLRYNSHISHLNFTEFEQKESTLMLGEHGVDYVVVGNLDENAFKISHLRKKSKAEVVELADSLELYTFNSTKEQVIAELMDVSKREYYTNIFNNKYWRDLPCDFVATGYCQGDAVKVLVVDQGYEHITVEYVSNIFFDSPITGTIELYYDDKLMTEVYVNEFVDEYSFYDKDKLIESIKSNYTGLYKVALFERLDSLPKQLNYI